MLIFFLGVSLAAEGFLVADLVVRQSGANFLAAVVQSEIIALTNAERADSKVGALTEQAQLDHAAQAKARDMAAQGYFAHVGPDGTEPWAWIANAGYNYRYAGENLAVRFVDSKDVVNAWMASPTHRVNIVKPVYTDIGVGVAEGLYLGQPATFVVQYFATGQPGQVDGVEVGPAAVGNSNVQSFWQEVEKQFVRLTSEPRATTQWVLGGIAVLMLVALALTFFVHLHVQPTEMLIGGGAVALFVVSLIAINTHFLSTTLLTNNNPASVALSQSAVVIGQNATSTAP